MSDVAVLMFALVVCGLRIMGSWVWAILGEPVAVAGLALVVVVVGMVTLTVPGPSGDVE